MLLSLPLLVAAQKKQGQALIDSLRKELDKAKEDTNKVNIFVSLAQCYDVSNPKEGIKYAELGLGLAKRLNYKTGIAKSYSVMGGLNSLQGKLSEGLQCDSIALTLFKELGNKHGIANGYYNMGIAYEQGNYEEALKDLLLGLKIFEEEQGNDDLKKSGIINSNNAIGMVYCSKGNYLQALEHCRTALKASSEIADKKRMGISYSNLGVIYYYIGNYPEALTNYFSALRICEEMGQKSGVADGHVNIGTIYELQNNHSDALKNFSSALTLYEEIGNKNSAGIALQNMGGVYSGEGNDSEALKYYSSALKLYEETSDKNGMGDCYQSFGIIYDNKVNYPEALNNYFISLRIFEEIGNKNAAAKSLECIGNTFCKQKKYVDAENYEKRALKIAKELGSNELIKKTNEVLSDLYARMGDYKKSLECYKLFVAARDTLFNEENTKKIVQTQMQYDFDKKESLAREQQAKKDAVLKLKLQQKNVSIYGTLSAFTLLLVIGSLLLRQSKLSANQQKAELEQKQLRAQMNPHFIFNCLNSIQHFIVANDVKNANKYLSGFALLMRQTLENSKDGVITLRREIEYLENYLVLERMRFEDKFTYEIICADDVNKDTIEIPSMIIQPFIENAIRHGLCYLVGKAGLLKINFYLRDNSLYCMVDDNGIGREQSHKLKMVSDMVYESQGMELTRKRLALVSKSAGAEYKIDITDKMNDQQQAEGTTVIIKFPLDA